VEMMDDSLLVRQEKQYASCPLQLLLRGLNSISPSLASFCITKSIHAQPKELEEGGYAAGPGTAARWWCRWLAAEKPLKARGMCSCSQDLVADDAAAGCSVGVIGTHDLLTWTADR